MDHPIKTCGCGRVYEYDRKKGHRLMCCNSCNANRKRVARKQKCVEYKGGKCQKCGYSRSTRALSFHHRDRSLKAFSINRAMSLSWEKVKAELDKCDMLCANCHMEEEEVLAGSSVVEP